MISSLTVHGVPWRLIAIVASSKAFIRDLDNRTEDISASLQVTNWKEQLMHREGKMFLRGV